MPKILLLFTFILPLWSFATRWDVGSAGSSYAVPSQVASLVNDGDTVEISGKEYLGDVCTWTKNNLIIIGVNGRPHLRANGNNIQGKGIWVITGINVRVENIEFSEATVPDENGAGIRAEGQNLHIIRCYFHHNENGILTNASISKITVENSEFGYNGIAGENGGYTHNIYIGNIDTAYIRFNYFHHAHVGHEFKSRARVNYILYNRFSNEATGTASRNIDLSNGGLSYIIGNVIEQGPGSDNSNMVGYGLEGLSNTAPHALFVINNTFVNNKTAGSFLHVQNGISQIKIYNNIFTGPGTVLNFGGATDIIDSITNIVQPDKQLMHFVNANAYDYHLTTPVGAGTEPGVGYNNFSLLPAYEYQHIAQGVTRINTDQINIGAFAFSQTLPLQMESISASVINKQVLLHWQTISESGIQIFDVQKSVDGVSFSTIGSIGAFNKDHNSYTYTDYGFVSSIQYYRLQIVEQDGKHFFSKTVAVKSINNTQLLRATVSNNNILLFNIPGTFKNTSSLIQLYDYAGRKIYQQQIYINDNSLTVPLTGKASIKQGIILVLSNTSNSITLPLVLQ